MQMYIYKSPVSISYINALVKLEHSVNSSWALKVVFAD